LPGGERIPFLEDALESMRARVVNVEIKTEISKGAPLSNLARRVRHAGLIADVLVRSSHEGLIVSSFDPVVIACLAARLPRIPRAILVGTETPGAALALPLLLRRLVVAAHLDVSLVTAARVERLKRASLRVAAWTVNDPARALRLRASGVPWFITDDPATIVAAFSGRAVSR
jgi:glycerophosphoryl diester phosphodiesterase